MILAAKMMLDWLGEKYDDKECLKGANAIENAVATTLRKSKDVIPDLGGKAKTIEMAKAMAKEIINRK
jgi:isocitrate/isopropylmalate dehydrogenase